MAPAYGAETDWSECLKLFGESDVPGLCLGWRAMQAVRLAQPVANLLNMDSHLVLGDLMALKVLAGVRFYRDAEATRYIDGLEVLCERARVAGFTDLASEIGSMVEASGDVVQYAQ